MNISVVVPTIRQESYERFLNVWNPLFDKHHIDLITVFDGDEPKIVTKKKTYSVYDVMGEDSDLIYNKSDVVRNVGFVVAKRDYHADYILTLDDDVEPHGDTIQDHLNALQMTFPRHWMSTASEYVRGVPYKAREEMECVVSHGVWEGVKDWDAPTQLIKGNPDVTFYKGNIPHGVYFPFCGMNVMFKIKVLPFMYYAPMGHRVGLDRFGDIWCGITMKQELDKLNLAVATGYATVWHNRASNVWKNLQKEAIGLEYNEMVWDNSIYESGSDEAKKYFEMYDRKRREWKNFI